MLERFFPSIRCKEGSRRIINENKNEKKNAESEERISNTKIKWKPFERKCLQHRLYKSLQSCPPWDPMNLGQLDPCPRLQARITVWVAVISF